MDTDNRIYELEYQLERVLDLFEESGPAVFINTEEGEMPLLNMDAQIIREAIEVLYAQDDQADGTI